MGHWFVRFGRDLLLHRIFRFGRIGNPDMVTGFYRSLYGVSFAMALTFGTLVPALKYAFHGYDAFLGALPLIPAVVLAGFSIARPYSFAGTVPNVEYSASAIWLAASQGLFFSLIMTLHYGVEHAVPEILFIILGGIQLILMRVPDASAKRDPQFDTIDLALPFIAAAVLCVGVRIDDDMASIIILTSLVILCSRARVGEYDSPNATDDHRRFGIGLAIFLLIFMG